MEYTVSSSMRRGVAAGVFLVLPVTYVPVCADSDMSDVDLFDFAFTYGMGLEFPSGNKRFLVECRFDLSIEALPMPTYAYVPFGDE